MMLDTCPEMVNRTSSRRRGTEEVEFFLKCGYQRSAVGYRVRDGLHLKWTGAWTLHAARVSYMYTLCA